MADSTNGRQSALSSPSGAAELDDRTRSPGSSPSPDDGPLQRHRTPPLWLVLVVGAILAIVLGLCAGWLSGWLGQRATAAGCDTAVEACDTIQPVHEVPPSIATIQDAALRR
ncbi:hypothetical protein HII28_07040 [Planctomonas sp. JC2975]|uniref:hypothetical protein n=1 Tax=Planctomonas sp. JC2975 TaxID=2729626 RepID=UPI0014741701|nr:hypothetical protein [Planctomonas sp. JC2975]NNC11630.1 hypothetical protein [Planctomonas sp. JC2975]